MVSAMTSKAQPTTGHLKGTLRTGDGMPFERGRVEIDDASTDAFPTARSTDGSGWFGFVDLPLGRQLLDDRQVECLGSTIRALCSACAETPAVITAPRAAQGDERGSDERRCSGLFRA